jgi:hypothetical protein
MQLVTNQMRIPKKKAITASVLTSVDLFSVTVARYHEVTVVPEGRRSSVFQVLLSPQLLLAPAHSLNRFRFNRPPAP